MRVSTGISRFDEILHGGLIPARVYLVHGEPGTGKTTLGFHFLVAGAAARQKCLLIAFDQVEENIRADARSLGLNLDGVTILDLMPVPEIFYELKTYDIFSPVEVEREPITLEILKAIQENDPRRIFVDGFGHLGEIAGDPFHRRRLIQSFFRFATQRGATLMIASEEPKCARDVDGVIHLECTHDLRSLRVTKFRGSDSLAGRHPMRITSHGLEIPSSAA